MRKLLILSSLLALAAGCKGKPEHRPPPQNAPVAAGSGAHGSNAGPRTAPDLALPKGPGGPPTKTTAPITVEKMQELKKLTYPGFKPEMKQLDDKAGFEVEQRTEDHPKLAVRVALKPCTPADCVPMDLAKWKERTEALKLMVPADIRSNPETEFEVGQTDLDGTPMIYTYQLAGLTMGSDGTGGYYTDAYILYYNDGVNQARVIASYIDDPTTKDGLKKQAPKEDLENLAKAFMDVYTHAW